MVTPEVALQTCPECDETLEEGTALSLAAFLSSRAYVCNACKVIYTHDLQLLAKLV